MNPLLWPHKNGRIKPCCRRIENHLSNLLFCKGVLNRFVFLNNDHEYVFTAMVRSFPKFHLFNHNSPQSTNNSINQHGFDQIEPFWIFCCKHANQPTPIIRTNDSTNCNSNFYSHDGNTNTTTHCTINKDERVNRIMLS